MNTAATTTTPAAWPTADALAQAFGDVIREWLTTEQLHRAIRSNKSYAYREDVCASHDYCDANMAMLEAWSELTGVDEDAVDLTDDTMHALWNDAWQRAKRADFGVDHELTRDPDGTFGFVVHGIEIEWPLASENSIDAVSPDYYGFFIWETGGGCTAWRRDFTYKGKPVHMLLTNYDEASHEIALDATALTVGVYDDEGDWFVCWTLEFGGAEGQDDVMATRSNIKTEGSVPA